MAEAIVQRFKGPVGTEHPIRSIDLIPGRGGIFDVCLDGELVFSKHQVGRHAEPEEVLAAVAEAIREAGGRPN